MPMTESAWRSRSIVRRETPNSAAICSAVKRGVDWTLMRSSRRRSVRDMTAPLVTVAVTIMADDVGEHRNAPTGQSKFIRQETDVSGENIFAAARDFIYREGRLLDQRVLEALRGYRNAAGGFGHGLEPDKRCPASQPLDVETALQTMDAAGAVDAGM